MQMNDAHIYCSEKQFEQEFTDVIELYLEYFKLFGITEYSMRLSTHDPSGLGKKYINNPALWLKTEDMVRKAMDHSNIPYYEVANEAAFYGPKIDVQVKSVIGKEFTLATNQVDFAQSERFELEFTNEAGQKERPLIIHRAPLSTHERLIGFLLEQYAGAFPVWLSPIQVAVIPIADRHQDYARKLEMELKSRYIRVEVDYQQKTLNNKIRQAQEQKVPYMLILGDKEVDNNTVSVRFRHGEQKNALPFDDFIDIVTKAISEKTGN